MALSPRMCKGQGIERWARRGLHTCCLMALRASAKRAGSLCTSSDIISPLSVGCCVVLCGPTGVIASAPPRRRVANKSLGVVCRTAFPTFAHWLVEWAARSRLTLSYCARAQPPPSPPRPHIGTQSSRTRRTCSPRPPAASPRAARPTPQTPCRRTGARTSSWTTS